MDFLLIRTSYFAGWYLSCAFFWYAIFWLLNKLKLSWKIQRSFYLASGIAILLFGETLWGEQAFSFLIGILFFQYSDKLPSLLNKKTEGGLIITFIAFFLMKQVVKQAVKGGILNKLLQLSYKLPLALLLILSCYLVMRYLQADQNTDKRNLIMQTAGTIMNSLFVTGVISYALYLVHGELLGMIKISGNKGIAMLLLYMPACYILSFVLHAGWTRIKNKLIPAA